MRILSGLMLLAMMPLFGFQVSKLSRDDLDRRITSVHTKVYSVENLLLKPYETAPLDDVKAWRQMMAEVTTFVAASNPPKEAAGMMDRLNQASEQLIAEREQCWMLCVSPALVPTAPSGLSRLDPAKINFNNLDLGALIDADSALQATDRKVIQVQADVDKLKAGTWFLTQARRDGLEVISRLALTLQLTIEKFHTDLLNLKKARDGK